MNELRECPFCGSVNADLDKHEENCYLRFFSGMMAGERIVSDVKLMVEYWNTRYTPKHETVSQWESRTGEKYPDDGPVWYADKLFTYAGLWKKKGVCIVATHHGKPEIKE